jgi:hypothetical protein
VDQLQPENFVKKWMKEPILVNPMRAFCVSEAVDRSRWKGICVSTGVLFDRCRLVDFSDGLAPNLLKRIRRWTDAAIKTVAVNRSPPRSENSKGGRRGARHASRGS